MFRQTFGLLALALLPTIVSAQPRGGRSMGTGKEGNYEEMMKDIGTGPKLMSRDVENMSPLKFLADKRKDLKLTDDQQKQFKELDGKAKETNAPLLKTVDSLVKAMKPTSSVPSAEDQVRVVLAREALMKVIGDIRTNYDAAVTNAMPQLDDAQKGTAKELLEKQRKENEDTLREKLGGRGPRPDGDGPPRGRRG